MLRLKDFRPRTERNKNALNSENARLWFFLIIMAVFLFQAYESKHQKVISDFNYPKFSDAVKAGEVSDSHVPSRHQ